MPIFSYFAVAGTVLLGLLLWVSNEIEPGPPPIATSQVVGLPKPFKAPPDVPRNREAVLARADNPEPPAANIVKQVSATQKKKASRKVSKPPAQNRVAEYPPDRLNIH
jgi:hypothetical protein